MPSIGVLGGMGPAATVDFLAKLVALTPARRDQDHLPVVVVNLPDVPDRSAAIVAGGADPLRQLRRGVELLEHAGCGVIAITCNSAHHWHEALAASTPVPILHIADAAAARLQRGQRVLLLGTRGTLASGFYQRRLEARGALSLVPRADVEQDWVDDCIRQVKAGDLAAATASLQRVLDASAGADAVLMACTELPLAAARASTVGLALVDATLEFARATVAYGLERGWNRSAAR